MKKRTVLNEHAASNNKELSSTAKENIQLYLLMLIPLVLIFIFSYLPMFGLVIAFQQYVPGRPFFGEGVTWVGLKWFKQFVQSYYFLRILRNTLRINLLHFLLGFWVPIAFSITLSEVKNSKFRKVSQTVSYMPYFISNVVVAGMVLSFIASDGIITKLLTSIGANARSLNTNQAAYPWIYVLTMIWKSFGWDSILYLSTITSIDPALYEAAAVDGAGRMKRIWYITLPSMLPLITILLILQVGGLLGSNTDMTLLLYNPSVYETADVLGSYIYRESLLRGKYSFGTATGLLLSLMSFALVFIANRTSRKYADYSMW